MNSASTTRSFGYGNFDITVQATLIQSSAHDIVNVRVTGYRGDVPAWMDRMDWDDLCRNIANDLTHDLSHGVSPNDVRNALIYSLGTAAGAGLE